jgi:TolB-like protein/lipoprotein NlpI
VAVLPLENLSGDPQQEIFADGMTDELTTMLARIKALRVISRTSVVGYKGTRKPLPQIARELKVDAVVEGSVWRSGNKVRITAQLINAASDEHLWAETYERDLSDVMGVQSEVAQAIARHVFVELTAEERQHIRVAQRINPAAHDAVLRARSLWNRRDQESLQQAIDYFQQALKLEPNYAMAYVGIADSYNALGYSNYLSPADSFVRAKAAATKALELDPDFADAHASYGYATMYYDWDFGRAEREFRAALDLNPSSPQAHQWYAYLLTAMERPSEAHAHIDIAQQLDPVSVPINTDRAFTYYYAGQTDESIQFVKTALQINPKFPLAHFWLGRIYTSQGRYNEALAEFTQTGELRNWQPTLAGLGFLYGIWGKRDDASRVLEELNALPRQNRYRTSYAVALVYCGMGDKDATFRWLEEAYRERSHWLVWLKTDPRWNSVRSDPRFKDLVRRVGLPI